MRTIKALCDIMLKGWSLFYGHYSIKIKSIIIIVYFIMVYFIVYKIKLSETQIDTILTNLLSALSIFTALAYGILFIGPEKLTERISILENRIEKQKRFFDDADGNSLKRYTKFIKTFNQYIFFVSLMSLVIITLIFAKWVISNEILSRCLITLIAGCSIILLLYLFKIVATLYRLNNVSISDSIEKIEDMRKLNKPNDYTE